MLKTTGFDIVFQEIPNEVTFAINISNCPFRCPGCHSSYLQEDTGNVLTKEMLTQYISKYRDAITCVLFLGGDSDVDCLYEYTKFIKEQFPGLKTAWYSGRENAPNDKILEYLDFIKLGPYKKELGGLKSKTTNQRLYKINQKELEDITYYFYQ